MHTQNSNQPKLISILLFCMFLLFGCTSNKLDGKWVWSAQQNGKPLAKGFFNLIEEKGGKVLGTSSTVIDDQNPDTMAFVTIHFEGKREGDKLTFTVNEKGIKADNEATIASNEIKGHTVQTMPYDQNLGSIGQAFQDPSGKQMMTVEYDWTATRFKEKT